MEKCVDNGCNLHQYADDTQLYKRKCVILHNFLQHNVNRLEEYINRLGLKIIGAKSKLMSFGLHQDGVISDDDINNKQRRDKCSRMGKNLGFIIDKELPF